MKDKLIDYLSGELQKSAENLQWHIDLLLKNDDESNSSSNIDLFADEVKDLKDYILWLKKLKDD